MVERLPDGSTYQTFLEAVTGLFDPRRKGKPPVNQKPDSEKDDRDQNPDDQDDESKWW